MALLLKNKYYIKNIKRYERLINMFDFIKNLFKKKNESSEDKSVVISECVDKLNAVVKQINAEGLDNTVVIRNGCIVKLSPKISKYLKDNLFYYTVKKANNKPTSIQVMKTVNSKTIYIGSLRKMFGIKKFKDGNVCNFEESNLIYK